LDGIRRALACGAGSGNDYARIAQLLLSKVSDTGCPNALTKGVIVYRQNRFSRVFSTICKKCRLARAVRLLMASDPARRVRNPRKEIEMDKFASILLAFMVAAVALPTLATAATSNTVENLQTAYNGESNAHARYLAFAQKADQEQYGEIASLFRAAAKA